MRTISRFTAFLANLTSDAARADRARARRCAQHQSRTQGYAFGRSGPGGTSSQARGNTHNLRHTGATARATHTSAVAHQGPANCDFVDFKEHRTERCVIRA